MRRSQACKGASHDTDAAGQDTNDVVSTAGCGNEELFDAIGAAGINLMIGTESLTESFVTAENGFSSGKKITNWQEE